MLTETPLAIPTAPDLDHRPARGVTSADPRDLPGSAELAAHEVRAARIERALDAVEALGRRRRAQELVEAIERLGAGLGTTMVALDDALAVARRSSPDAAPLAGPAPEAPAWIPISAPVVPITSFVVPADAVPAPVAAPSRAVVPAPVAAAPVASPAPVAASAPTVTVATPVPAPVPAARPRTEAPAPVAAPRARRQAPAGLAAFVIDFPEIQG